MVSILSEELKEVIRDKGKEYELYYFDSFRYFYVAPRVTILLCFHFEDQPLYDFLEKELEGDLKKEMQEYLNDSCRDDKYNKENGKKNICVWVPLSARETRLERDRYW